MAYSLNVFNFTNVTDVETNFSLDEFILGKLGPKRMDNTSNVLLTVIYSLVFISGTIGNVCTCIVIARNSYMQTTTNYYLSNLAISDLLLLLFGLPPELYAIWESYPWRFGQAFCILRRSVLETTSYASVLTITAFTVERYVAICRPLQAHRMAGPSRCVRIILAIWIIALLLALPFSVHTRVFYELHHPITHEPIPESLICNIQAEWRGRMTYMFQVSTFLFFVTPVAVIICLYVLIGVALRRSSLGRAASDESKGTGVKSRLPNQPRKVVIRMLVAVTVAFILCWAPFHAQRLMVLYVAKWTPLLMNVQSKLFYISGVLYFVSATVNPILYNVISLRYRNAFKETICWCCHSKKPSGYTSSFGDRGHTEKLYQKPMADIQKEHSSHHVTFQEHNPLLHPVANGNVSSAKTRLLSTTSESGRPGKNVNTCATCENYLNGYITPAKTKVVRDECVGVKHSVVKGVLKKNGTVL